MNAECPASDWLERFEAGQLSDGASQPIERHVIGCEKCAERLRYLRRANPDARFARELFRRTGSTRILASSENVAEAPDEGLPEIRVQPAGEPVRPAALAGHAGWSIPDYERIQLCGEGATDRCGRCATAWACIAR